MDGGFHSSTAYNGSLLRPYRRRGQVYYKKYLRRRAVREYIRALDMALSHRDGDMLSGGLPRVFPALAHGKAQAGHYADDSNAAYVDELSA